MSQEKYVCHRNKKVNLGKLEREKGILIVLGKGKKGRGSKTSHSGKKMKHCKKVEEIQKSRH